MLVVAGLLVAADLLFAADLLSVADLLFAARLPVAIEAGEPPVIVAGRGTPVNVARTCDKLDNFASKFAYGRATSGMVLAVESLQVGIPLILSAHCSSALDRILVHRMEVK